MDNKGSKGQQWTIKGQYGTINNNNLVVRDNTGTDNDKGHRPGQPRGLMGHFHQTPRNDGQ